MIYLITYFFLLYTLNNFIVKIVKIKVYKKLHLFIVRHNYS